MSGGRQVVIVGGGPAAVSAFVHLTEVRGVESIRFLAPNPIGCAPAFGSGDPRLLCNTSVDVTSLRPDGTSDLLRYLAARGWPVHRADFVPRALVTQYARERYLRHRAAAERRGTKVAHTRGRAGAVTGSPGDYRITLTDGREVAATDVLFCLGGDTPQMPELLRGHAGAPRLLAGPYPVQRLRRIPGEARVLVLGTKLSAIDAALTLCRDGRRTVMASPSGELPAVRTRLCRTSGAGLAGQWARQLQRGVGARELLGPLLRAVRALGGGHPVRRGLSGRRGAHARLREETALAEAGQVPWQDAIAEVIDAANQVLPGLPEAVRRQVLGVHRGLMSRYISAIPVANARRLLAHMDAGTLSVADRYPRRVTPESDGWRVEWPDGTTEHVDWIVSATGVEAPCLSVTPDGELRVGAAASAGPDAVWHGMRPVAVEQDLRLIRTPDAGAERLWALGASAGTRVPIVNYLRAAAQHAQAVAHSIDSAASDAGREAFPAPAKSAPVQPVATQPVPVQPPVSTSSLARLRKGAAA